MSPSANVLAIHAIEELKGALGVFTDQAQDALRAVEGGIRRTMEYLQERLAYWRREVQRRQEIVRQAEAALARCQASGYRDREGRYYPPDCSAHEYALRQARFHLQKAEAELQNVQRWTRRVQKSVADYQQEAQRLAARLNSDLPKAAVLLGKSITILHSYTTMAPPAGRHVPPASPSTSASTAKVGSGAWEERGILDVSIERVDLSDSHVKGKSDFYKVSYEEMKEGIRKLESVVRPAVQSGANGDYFSQMDAKQGLDHEHGYRRIYDAFYGDTAIRLEKVGNTYNVVNGYHRLLIATEMGLKNMPARVIAKGG